MKKIKTANIKDNVNDLGSHIDEIEFLYQRMLEIVSKLEEKEHYLNSLIKSFQRDSDTTKKTNEMHTIHFPTNNLKKIAQRERFLAQILLTPTKRIFN